MTAFKDTAATTCLWNIYRKAYGFATVPWRCTGVLPRVVRRHSTCKGLAVKLSDEAVATLVWAIANDPSWIARRKVFGRSKSGVRLLSDLHERTHGAQRRSQPELRRLLQHDPQKFLDTYSALQKIVPLDTGRTIDTFQGAGP